MVVDGFANSAESLSLYGSGDAKAFVTAIYRNVLGRTADPGGLDFWSTHISDHSLTQGPFWASDFITFAT